MSRKYFKKFAADDILDIYKYLIKKEWCKIMFGFSKKIFFTVMAVFTCYELKCVSMNNRKCKVGLTIININSNEPLF